MELLRPVAMAMAMGCSSSSSTPRTKAAGLREAGKGEEAGNSGEATDVGARRNRSGSSAVAGAPWPWRLSWEEEAWEREEVPKASDRTQVKAKEVHFHLMLAAVRTARAKESTPWASSVSREEALSVPIEFEEGKEGS